MKKAFFDSADAVKTLGGVPEEDIDRILGVLIPPQLANGFLWVLGLQVDTKCQIAVGFCNSFHGGYSVAISDLSAEEPRNQHLEYMHEQQQRNANGAPDGAAVGNRGNS